MAQGSCDWIQVQIETCDARILKMQHFELQTNECFSIMSMVLAGCVIVEKIYLHTCFKLFDADILYLAPLQTLL